MKQYDFDIDMTQRTNITMLLEKVAPGSRVLEFGPGGGRMTRYMKQQLGCQVAIVELSRESYEQVMAFADEGVCADIEQGAWKTTFEGREFDVIIFADVLEHLRDPAATLLDAKALLSPNGLLLISVPNLAHNAVLVDLYNDRFQYRDYGLLDDTHVHFFARQNLLELFTQLHLRVVSEESANVAVGMTELQNTYAQVPWNVQLALRQRTLGSAYQYVYALASDNSKLASDTTIQTVLSPTPSMMLRLHVDTGSGFIENQTIKKQVYPGQNSHTFDLAQFEDANAFRLDFAAEPCHLYCEALAVDSQPLEPDALKGSVLFQHGTFYALGVDGFLVIKPEKPARQSVTLTFLLEPAYEQPLLNDALIQNNQQQLLDREQLLLDLKQFKKQYDAMCEQAASMEQEYEAAEKRYQQALSIYETTKNRLNKTLDELAAEQKRTDGVRAEANQAWAERAAFVNEYNAILSTLSWRITKPLRSVAGLLRGRGRSAPPAANQSAAVDTPAVVSAALDEEWRALNEWIDETPHTFIDIFPIPMGWATPLFQRFQHLSLQAGNIGGIAIYGAHPGVDTDVHTYKFVSPTLCIVNLDSAENKQKLFDILDAKDGLKVIRLESIDLATRMEEVQQYQEKGYAIVYEYIDEITPDITGNVPGFVYTRHHELLNDETVAVVATSTKLYDEVERHRRENLYLLPNGVDYEHWQTPRQPVPKDLVPVLQQDKIVLGYHGALARWLDYPLLQRLADDGRFVILLIGYLHDDAADKSGILDNPNVYYLGSKSYFELNQYTVHYDIGLLPFMLSELTLSVSPVKIFEYMAAGKPCVCYCLPECTKYASCLCASTQDEFVEQVEKAMVLRDDPQYLAQLEKDAKDNTWQEIARKTVFAAAEAMGVQFSELRRELPVLKNAAVRSNYLQQILLVPDKSQDDYVPLARSTYQRQEGDAKIIAYYLTQFHPDAHNDVWWGKGTTEWNNVTRAVPQYVGHYQPRQPGELGFYDLRVKDNMRRQIELARMYGIYGFSFYYYWFNGERLLEQPLEAFLADPSLDFPFSLCWANENWTRKFDGTDSTVLMEMPKDTECYKEMIHDAVRFLKDPRYITIKGKKLLTVYRPDLMPDVKTVLDYWREYCRSQGVGELYLMAVKVNAVETDFLELGYDAFTEFHPGTLYTQCKNITDEFQYIRDDFCGEVYSYQDIVENKKYFKYDYPKLYRAVMPMWDNTARRNNKGMIFEGATPDLYQAWLEDVIEESTLRSDLDDKLLFINAWNEWGEGAYLEPDAHYGYAFLNATRKALENSRKKIR